MLKRANETIVKNHFVQTTYCLMRSFLSNEKKTAGKIQLYASQQPLPPMQTCKLRAIFYMVRFFERNNLPKRLPWYKSCSWPNVSYLWFDYEQIVNWGFAYLGERRKAYWGFTWEFWKKRFLRAYNEMRMLFWWRFFSSGLQWELECLIVSLCLE